VLVLIGGMAKPTHDTLANLVTQRLYAARQYRESTNVFEGQTIEGWFADTFNDYNRIYPSYVLKRHPDIYGYFGLTNLKVDACVAHLISKYAHAIDAPFVFEVSQNPELSDKDKIDVDSQLDKILNVTMGELNFTYEPRGSGRSILQPNGVIKPDMLKFLEEQRKLLVENRRELSIAKAKEAAVFHEGYIKDQLMVQASGWNQSPVKHWKDWVTYPYAVMVGNEYKNITDPVWTKSGIKLVQKTIPTFRSPDPWDIYIASDAATAQDGQGVTEIIMRTKQEFLGLRELEKSHGYKVSEIDRVIEDRSSTSYGWMENTDYSNKRYMHHGEDCYLCMIHQGAISSSELSDHGITGFGNSKTEYFNAVIEVVGNRTIRFEVLKTINNKRNYFSSSYSPSSGYAGQSVAMKLHERQMEINELMFSKARNQWQSSGPNLFPNANYFDSPEDFQLEPYSISFSRPNENGNSAANGRPFDQFQITPMFRMLTQEVRELMILADEECGIPSMFSGTSRGGTSNTTLGGAVLQQTNGEAGMEAAIFSLDKSVYEPMFTQLHYANLLDSSIEKEYKRGDLQIVGRGIFGKKREELRRREMLQLRPMLDADAQRQIVPKKMYADSVKQMYSGSGFDTSSMAGGLAGEEVSSLSNLHKPDARSYTPNQENLGSLQ
jgi:hypothetical protein